MQDDRTSLIWYDEPMKPIYLLIVPIAIVAYAVVSGLILYMNVARFTDYWRQRSNKSAPSNAIVYVALGDSAAQGLGATDPNKGYVGQFAQKLSDKEGRPVQVINISKSGARIQDVIKDQLPQLPNYKPDVVTLDIGGNDIADYESGKFRNDFSLLLEKLPQGTLVGNIPYFGGRTQLPFFGSGQAEKDVLEANQIIKELMVDKPYKAVELHDITKDRSGRRIWNYAIDYFHPNARGYKAWTEAYWKAYRG